MRQTEDGLINDRNFDDEINWLMDRLILTQEERNNLLKICPYFILELPADRERAIQRRLTDSDKEYILRNCKKMTVPEMAFEIRKGRSAIREFLLRRKVNFKKAKEQPKKPLFNEQEADFLFKNYETMTVKELATVLKVDDFSKIRRFLAKYGKVAKRAV